jgi:hypothetical protein
MEVRVPQAAYILHLVASYFEFLETLFGSLRPLGVP